MLCKTDVGRCWQQCWECPGGSVKSMVTWMSTCDSLLCMLNGSAEHVMSQPKVLKLRWARPFGSEVLLLAMALHVTWHPTNGIVIQLYSANDDMCSTDSCLLMFVDVCCPTDVELWTGLCGQVFTTASRRLALWNSEWSPGRGSGSIWDSKISNKYALKRAERERERLRNVAWYIWTNMQFHAVSIHVCPCLDGRREITTTAEDVAPRLRKWSFGTQARASCCIVD